MPALLIAVLVVIGLGSTVRFWRRQQLFIVAPLLMACAVGLFAFHKERTNLVELRGFIRDSCDLLADRIQSDAEEFKSKAAAGAQSGDQDVLRLQTSYVRASLERSRLAEKCLGGRVSAKCFPPALATTNVDDVLRAAEYIRAGKCQE